MVETTPQFSSHSSSNLEISAVGEREKPIRKDERRKDLEAMYHSGLNNFCNMIVPLPESQTHHPACAQAPRSPPSPTHAFLTQQNFTNPSPCLHFFCAYEVAQSPHENSMVGADTRSVLVRFGDNYWEKGEDFVITFYVKNLCGRWRGA